MDGDCIPDASDPFWENQPMGERERERHFGMTSQLRDEDSSEEDEEAVNV